MTPATVHENPIRSRTFTKILLLGKSLLWVKQVANRLGVSTATVYKLCASGELVHVRVLNAIRVEPAVLAAFVRGR